MAEEKKEKCCFFSRIFKKIDEKMKEKSENKNCCCKDKCDSDKK
jgi:hypothetical protein